MKQLHDKGYLVIDTKEKREVETYNTTITDNTGIPTNYGGTTVPLGDWGSASFTEGSKTITRKESPLSLDEIEERVQELIGKADRDRAARIAEYGEDAVREAEEEAAELNKSIKDNERYANIEDTIASAIRNGSIKVVEKSLQTSPRDFDIHDQRAMKDIERVVLDHYPELKEDPSSLKEAVMELVDTLSEKAKKFKSPLDGWKTRG